MASAEQEADAVWMQGVKDRDPEMLRRLFDCHAPMMLALGRRMLGQNGDAEDVLSEVFWEVWDRPERYDALRGSVRAYLMLVMRSRCLDRLRSRKARPDGQGLTLDGHAHADASPSPQLVLQADESRVQVRQAVSELGEDQRRAIELSFYEGLSHREIAERLETPLGTIKGRLRSGLIALSRSLRKKGDETP